MLDSTVDVVVTSSINVPSLIFLTVSIKAFSNFSCLIFLFSMTISVGGLELPKNEAIFCQIAKLSLFSKEFKHQILV